MLSVGIFLTYSLNFGNFSLNFVMKVSLIQRQKNNYSELSGIQRFGFNCPCRQFVLIYLGKEIEMSAFTFLNRETISGRNQLRNSLSTKSQ